MKRTYRNEYGDGTVEIVEIDIPDPEDEDATDEEILAAVEDII